MQLLRFAVGTRPRSQRSHSYQGRWKLWCLEDFGSFRVLSLVRFTKFHQVSFIKSLAFSYRLARESVLIAKDPFVATLLTRYTSFPLRVFLGRLFHLSTVKCSQSGIGILGKAGTRHIAPKQPQHCAPSDGQVDTRPPDKPHRRKGPQMQGYWKKHSIQRKPPTIYYLSVLPEARDSKENFVTMPRH